MIETLRPVLPDNAPAVGSTIRRGGFEWSVVSVDFDARGSRIRGWSALLSRRVDVLEGHGFDTFDRIPVKW